MTQRLHRALGLDPALARLLVLKLRGRSRAALRRLRTPKGCAFGLVGAALFALWVAALVVRLTGGGARATSGAALAPSDGVALAQLAITLYACFAITANLSWRGLYLPRAEVERLFAAPVSRRALVRYRLLGMGVPSLFVAGLVGVMAAARVTAPWAGFCGGVLVVATATVLGQGAALLAAHEGGAVGRFVQRVPGGLPRLIGALGLAAVLLLLMFGEELLPTRAGALVRNGEVIEFDLDGVLRRSGRGELGLEQLADPSTGGTLGRCVEFARHPVARVVTAPAYPLAAAVAAPTFVAALPWLVLSLSIVLLCFELVVRLPIDYREASLSTSRDVERRLARLRRGQFGAAAGDGRTLVGWRVPWVFGTSPFGAVLWLKSATILRQGRGTLAVASITTAIGVLVGVTLLPEPGVGTASLVVMGVAYLASGLRFDFRAELDRMQSLRAWPLAAWQVFVAVVLPVTMLVSCFVCIVLAVRGIVQHDLSLDVLGAMCATPLVAFLWVALDNVVFLLFPVRFVPGMGGALQHSGRALLMVLMRLVLLAVAGTAALGVGMLASAAALWLGMGPAVVVGATISAAALTLVGFAALLAAAGGHALGRFDPAEASLASG
jgi:hypothetical protein